MQKNLFIFYGIVAALFIPAQALTPLECGQGIAQGLTHLFDHLHMGSVKADTAWGIFKHKMYGNLSDLCKAIHADLARRTFSSPCANYLCNKIDMLDPKVWFVCIACMYVAHKAIREGRAYVKKLNKEPIHPEVLINGTRYAPQD